VSTDAREVKGRGERAGELVSELRFSLLGPFQVWRGDARLDAALSGRLARELLAFLLLERDRLVPAERLMDVFWPHLGATAAANNLQGVVLRVRRWLEPGLRRGRDSDYLVTEGEGYRFLAAGCRLDMDEFAQAAQAGHAALHSDDLPAACAALQRARDLYRGELLDDMPYAEWAFPARERLREAHLEALDALGQTCLRLGAYDETLVVDQHARAIDPLRESFVRQQMQARAALGERAEALAVCDDFRRALDRELGLEPSEETRALREAIVTGTIAPLAPAIPAATSVELPLVGRDEILESLQRVREHGAGVVLLSGEAGLGKTRLLTEFGAATAAPGTPLFGSQAHAHDPPFAAVLRLFEEYLRCEPTAADLAELGPLGAPLAQRLPALRLHWPGCPAYTPLEGEAEQQRLHQATLAALRLVMARPAVLVLDDLHWADECSLAVLADLSHGDRWPAGVLFVGAYRSEEAGPDGPLADWLAARREALERPLELELPPLSRADVLAAVRGVVGLPDPLPFSRRLHDVTAGHPLFLTEMLRGLLDAGIVYRDADGAWHGGLATELNELPLTATLRDAVLARADRLDPIEREVLDAAAVLRPRCAAPVLLTVLQTDEARLDSALQTLTAGRWLVAVGADGWEFSHHLTGEAVYAGVAPPHRRLLHRLAATALIAAAPAAPDPAAAEIVAHLDKGEGTAEALAGWAVLAGQWAAQQFSYRQARAHFELAREQLDRLVDDDGKRRVTLSVYEGLGTIQPRIGESKAALESLRKALPLASDLTDRARLLLAEAHICERDTGEYERAIALLAQAEELLGQAGVGEPAALAELRTIESMVRYWRGEHREGERLARHAAAGARGTPGEPRALHALASNLQKLGRLEEALGLYERMLQLAEEAGDMRGVAEAQLSLGVGLHASGQLAASQAAEERAAEALERLGDLRRLSVAYTNHGITAGETGDLDRSEADLRHAIELAEKVGAPYTVAVARHHLGRSLTLRGRFEQAGVELESAVALAQTIAAKVIEAQARLHLGLWHWARGDGEGARAQAQMTVDTGDALTDNFCRREGRLLLGAVSMGARDLEAAHTHAKDAHRIASEGHQALAVGRAERLLGQVAAMGEAFEAATAHFAESERIFRRSGAQIELGETLLARAESVRASADAEVRRPLLLEARRLFRRTKARPLLRRAEELLAKNSASASPELSPN
jgi:DNA-binding SARP family transcriptional activator/Tfp pilus assembly protein PilF